MWNEEAEICGFCSMVFHPRLIGSMDSVYWQKYIKPLIENENLKNVILIDEVEWQKQIIEEFLTAWSAGHEEFSGYEFEVRNALSQIILLLKKYCRAEEKKCSEKELRNSESECLRCFRHTIGMPPIQYVRQFRIQKAGELLLSTDLKVSEIADLCGFQDISYFTKTFREMKGCPPKEYRNKEKKSRHS